MRPQWLSRLPIRVVAAFKPGLNRNLRQKWLQVITYSSKSLHSIHYSIRKKIGNSRTKSLLSVTAVLFAAIHHDTEAALVNRDMKLLEHRRCSFPFRCLRSVTKGHCIECLLFSAFFYNWERRLQSQKSFSTVGWKKSTISPTESGFRNPRIFCFWDPESWALESGIQLMDSGITLTTGIQNPSSIVKNWIPVPGIRNPRHGIQNPVLSWIPSHGATMLTDESLYRYFRQNRTTLTELRSEIFSNDQRWSHCHSGQGCQVSLVVQWEQRNSAKYHALWKFLVLLPKSIAFSVVVVVAPAPSSATAQNSTWYASHDFLEKTTTRWKTRAESDVRRYPYKDRLSSSALLLLELPIDCETVIRDFVQKSQKTCILLRNHEKLTLALKVPSQSKINFASYSLRR